MPRRGWPLWTLQGSQDFLGGARRLSSSGVDRRDVIRPEGGIEPLQ